MKDFNITWVEVSGNQAIATINFLLPMEQQKLEKCIKVQSSQVTKQSFNCKIDWISPNTVKIFMEETGDVKGQQVKLLIQKAPTKYAGLNKNEVLSIQFKEPVAILEPTGEQLIATEESFEVKFNTPMNANILHKYLKSDAGFYIEALPNDQSTFKFTPVTALENQRKYILNFSKGMPALSGVMLEDDMSIVLCTDVKPQITQTYPAHTSKWIGLYPRVTLRTDKPIVNAYLDLGKERIAGKVSNERNVEFILPRVLEPDHTYDWNVQVEAKSGEMSIPIPLSFTTVPIPVDRLWMEVVLGKPNQLVVYKGQKQIRKMICSGGVEKFPTHLGTYYVQGKGERFFLDEANRGANYWMKISDQVMLHGMLRDEYWNPLYQAQEKLGAPQTKGNVIVSEEDAKWLYERIDEDTMVIIHQ